jgi:hypothetical protein
MVKLFSAIQLGKGQRYLYVGGEEGGGLYFVGMTCLFPEIYSFNTELKNSQK